MYYYITRVIQGLIIKTENSRLPKYNTASCKNIYVIRVVFYGIAANEQCV